jgi:antitoxin component YwqK of YwqJK toxin-antitoxin module
MINIPFLRWHNSLTYIFLISCISLTLISCSKVKREYDKEGWLKSEITYRNGKMDGLATWYYYNRNKQLECTYKDGVLEGTVTRWFFNGNKEREDHFIADKKNGQSFIYDEKGGYKSAEENYVNDTLDGIYREWHSNGELLTEGRFWKGLYDGTWTYYDMRGIVVGKAEFKRGSGKQTGYFWNGHIKREISYKANKKDGREIWYNENGGIEKEILFENGKIKDIIQGDTTSVSSKFQ